MATLNKQFGKRLATLRKEKGISQQELADMMKTSKTTVANWESERFKPTWDKLDMLATILEVHVSALMDDEELISLKQKEAVQKQNPFIQYLYSIGYSFEYADESKNESLLPPNEKRKPSLQKEGRKIIFTEQQFLEFEKAISDSVEYQIWQHEKNQK